MALLAFARTRTRTPTVTRTPSRLRSLPPTGTGGLYFVGAYSLYALPLLENGVASAMKVAMRLGAQVPWLGSSGEEKGAQHKKQQAGGSGSSSSFVSVSTNGHFVWQGCGVDAWARNLLGGACFCNSQPGDSSAYGVRSA